MSDSSTGESLSGRDISVNFGGVAALNRVSIEVSNGAIRGLIGPNGAGKTTLVNVLTGFQRPDEGSVRIADVDVTRSAPDDLARRGIARTFQAARLFMNLSVLENVEVSVCAAGVGRRAAERRSMEILQWANLKLRSHISAGALPFGEERRVGIARALALAPKYLLLDEPAAGLSEQECDDLADLIRRIPTSFGCGVLLIEHNMPVVMQTCPELQVLDGGRTIALGPTEEVKRDRQVIEAYLGTVSGEGARAGSS
jgi:branched-chain amino acid transport system ATP-binding protein